MNQSLMKRIRNKLELDSFDTTTPLLGNVFINKDGSSVFEIDEVSIDNAKQLNYGIYGLDKSIKDSWMRFKRSGLLDKSFTEEEKLNENTLLSYSVYWDDIKKSYQIEGTCTDENIIKLVKQIMRIE